MVRGHGPEVARVPCVQRVPKPSVLEKCLTAYVWRDKSVVRLSGPYPEGRWFESNSRNHYLIQGYVWWYSIHKLLSFSKAY